ncbi:MAG: serine hydroxymethyltransferase [Chloroflexota bacterium]
MNEPAAVSSRNHIQGLVGEHEAWRRTTLNLIASENVVSPTVAKALSSDLVGRYADYPGRDASNRRYQGNRLIAEIEAETVRLAAEQFRARYVEMRAIAGHLAGLAVVMGVCRPGDVVLEPGRDGGGHREAGRLTAATLATLDVADLPFDARRFTIDAPAAVRMVEERLPRLVILGSSNFLFPHPVAPIAKAVHRIPGAVVAYDASHVMGFLVTGRFQDPLAEGADIVFGSTHKTFPGPQGGIIFSNNDVLMDTVTAALVPGLVTNHHPFRMPAMALALLEMSEWGGAYMDAIVANARALGVALDAAGVPVVEVAGRATDSHTLLIRVAEFGPRELIAARLEEAGIITTHALLPDAYGIEGIRIGTQEVTRIGADSAVMARVGVLIADAIRRTREPAVIRGEVAALVASLGPVRYTWPAADAA